MSLLDLLPIIGQIIDRIIPDPAAKAAAQLQLLQLQQSSDFKQLDADTQTALAQVATNTAEASSNNPFNSGWRPFIGWVCGVAFAFNFVCWPMLTWINATIWHAQIPPALDISQMMPVLLGMLGLGTLRTVERVQGVIPQGK